MRGTASLPSNAAFCSYPTEELQSGHRSSQSVVRAGEPMGDPAFGTQLHEKPPEDQLDSWKEIAAYLGRDVTTVQRWEKCEKMPVHRHAHDKRSSVYALTSELDAWRQSRKPRLDENDRAPTQNELESAAAVGSGPISQASSSVGLRRWLAVAGAVAIAVVGVAYVMHRGHTAVVAPTKIRSV